LKKSAERSEKAGLTRDPKNDEGAKKGTSCNIRGMDSTGERKSGFQKGGEGWFVKEKGEGEGRREGWGGGPNGGRCSREQMRGG